tara:strand:- start:24 stop:164 length:141 start_codon:yes stop_codon:yes gene_type:complete
MIDFISSIMVVEGPITALKLSLWVQGYLVFTGIGAVIKWIRRMYEN